MQEDMVRRYLVLLDGPLHDNADVGVLGYLHFFEEEEVVRLPGVPWWRP